MNSFFNFFKRDSDYLKFVSYVTLFFMLIYNIPYFIKYYGYSFECLHMIIVGTALTFATFYVFSLNRYIFLFMSPILFLIAGVATYYVVKYGLFINSHLLRVIFEADSREFSAFYEGYATIEAFGSLLIGGLFVYFRFKIKTWSKIRFVHCVVFCLLALGLHKTLNFEQRGRIAMPFLYTELFINHVTEVIGLTVINMNKTDITKEYDFVVDTDDDFILVLVIGESLDARHMGINGYERDTTPYMLLDKMISYKYTLSTDMYTRGAVPKMLSRNTTYGAEEDSIRETGLVALMRKLGFETHWYTNQGRLRHNAPVGIHMNEAEFIRNVSIVDNNRQTGSGHDVNILPYYNSAVDKNSGNKKLIVLHTFGSHWNSFDRYPDEFERFTPACKTLDKCPDEAFYNSYDNSVLYTDYFLHEVVKKLKGKNALMIYMSDHGPALERDRSPHTRINAILSDPSVRHIGFVVWGSEKFKNKNKLKYSNILSHTQELVSGDYFYHSALDCSNIHSDAIDLNMSICSDKMKEYKDKYFEVINGSLKIIGTNN